MTTMNDARKWDQIYSQKTGSHPLAAQVLVQNAHLLPETGDALDLACGRGANAMFLAQHGLSTQAWDISKVAINTLKNQTDAIHQKLHCQVRDVLESPPEPASFDVIVISRFLERSIVRALIAALRSGGLIFYQTFISEKLSQSGPTNPDYLLGKNELLHLFQAMQILVYREEGCIGNVTQGFRNEAMLVARNS